MMQKIIECSFYALFLITPLFWTSATSEVFELNKMLLTYLLTIFIVGAWTTKSILSRKIIFRRTLLDMPLLLFLLSQIISYQLSIDQHLSFWGYYSRLNGGLLSTIVYCLLYFAYVSNMEIRETKKVIRMILASATIVAGWAILEHFGYSFSCVFLKGEFNDNCWVQDVQTRVFASLGQPNWLAAWIVAISPLAWLMSSTKSQNKSPYMLLTTYYLLPIIFFLTLLFTQSRSGFFGFTVAYLIFWGGILFVNKFKHDVLKPFLILSGVFFIFTLIYGDRVLPQLTDLTRPRLVNETISTNNQQSTTNYSGGTESGDIRKIVWKGAIDIWRHYPIFGSGPETFALTYYNYKPKEHSQTSEWNLLYNKAHNEYLNYLANTGALGLVTYLILIIAIACYFVKSSMYHIVSSMWGEKYIIPNTYYILLALFSGWASILITNFFGFSVVVTNTLFFLLPAMAFSITQLPNDLIPVSKFKNKVITYPLLAIALLTTLYLLHTTISLWLADYNYNQGQKYIKTGWYAHATFSLNDALKIRPDEPIYYDKLASAASYLAVQEDIAKHSDKALDLVTLADNSSQLALKISPRNLTLLKSRAIIFTRLSEINPDYLKQATTPLEIAVELAPTDPEVLYNLGVIYSSLEEFEKAKDILEKAISLKPDYYEARVGLGEVYTKLKQIDKAKEQYNYVLDHINPEDEEIKDAIKNLK